MSLTGKWTDKQDYIDEVRAGDVNQIAGAVIELENQKQFDTRAYDSMVAAQSAKAGAETAKSAAEAAKSDAEAARSGAEAARTGAQAAAREAKATADSIFTVQYAPPASILETAVILNAPTAAEL